MRGIHYNIEHQSVPAFFIRGPSPIARLVFFSALSLTLIATDTHLKYLSSIRQNLEAYLHPLELVVNVPAELYRQTGDYFSSHHVLLAENKQLKELVLKKNVDLQQLNILKIQNELLRNLVSAKSNLNEQSMIAEILFVSRDRFTKKIVVNRGQMQKVVLGSAVVDADGIIGQVTRVFPSTSEVTLITDKTLEIPVMVERNGLRAIAFGHGQDNVIEIPYLPTNVDIKPGDKLVTSGIDGVYPTGIAVALVKKIDIAVGSSFAHITCIPTGGVEHNRHVLLVNMPPNAQAQSKALDSTVPQVGGVSSLSVAPTPQLNTQAENSNATH